MVLRVLMGGQSLTRQFDMLTHDGYSSAHAGSWHVTDTPETSPRWLSIVDAAQELGVHAATVRRWREQNGLPSEMRHNKVYVDVAAAWAMKRDRDKAGPRIESTETTVVGVDVNRLMARVIEAEKREEVSRARQEERELMVREVIPQLMTEIMARMGITTTGRVRGKAS